MDHPERSRTITIISLVAIVAGTVVIIGWIFDIPVFKIIVSGSVAMKFNTAICLVLSGSCLLLGQYKFYKYCYAAIGVLALFVTSIALVTLLQYLFHFNSGIDQLFITDRAIPTPHLPFQGRMAFNSTVNFMLLGLGFLLLTVQKRLFSIVSQYLFHAVTLISMIILIGHLYQVELFSTLFYVTSMPANSAILFLLLSVAASVLNPSVGIARLFTGKQIGNQMARRIFGLIIMMVILFGILKGQLDAQNLKLFSLEIWMSLLSICFLLISFIIIWNTANWLNKIDEQRSEAEYLVKTMNAGLEKMVEVRSVAFQKSEQRYRSLIEHASDAIYVVDFKGNFTEVNESMCEMTGYNRNELLELNIENIIDPDDLRINPLPRNLEISKVTERRFMSKNGYVFTVEINIKRFTDDRILVIARDISDRKKMETDLREAELKFRIIADKSMVGIYIVQKGKYIYVNPRFAAVFGYEPEELINTVPVETIIHESYRHIALEHVRQRMTGEVESIHYEVLGKRKDDTTNWVELYGSRTIIGGEPTIIGSLIDITERKKAEDELRSSERKYKLLFDSNPMPMWMIAKDTQSIIAVNEAAARHYGYTKDELLSMSIKVLRYKESLKKQTDLYRNSLTNLGSPRIVRHIKKDGTMIFVHIIANDIVLDGKAIRLSLTNDVTEKLRADELLIKSQANLQTILNTTDTAYALFDMDLNVLSFNQKAIQFAKEQYHHTPKKGDRFIDYFPEERFPNFLDLVKDVLKGRSINYEINYPQDNDSLLWYYVRLSPIINDKKEILGMMIALYDITERKTAEQDLTSAYTRIQSQISSIKDMAWKQSHLIRSPLANLKGLAAMLNDDPSDVDVLNYIQDELDRMDAVIVDMAKEASDMIYM